MDPTDRLNDGTLRPIPASAQGRDNYVLNRLPDVRLFDQLERA